MRAAPAPVASPLADRLRVALGRHAEVARANGVAVLALSGLGLAALALADATRLERWAWVGMLFCACALLAAFKAGRDQAARNVVRRALHEEKRRVRAERAAALDAAERAVARAGLALDEAPAASFAPAEVISAEAPVVR